MTRDRRNPSFVTLLAALVTAVVAIAGCSTNSGTSATDDTSGGGSKSAPTTQAISVPPHDSAIYSQMANWLCHPDNPADACHGDLDATVIAANGTKTVEQHVPADDPAVDCFYVYPTISSDESVNSDLTPGPEEKMTVQSQAARLNSECRVFAPVYRQVTLKALMGSVSGDRAAGGQMAYNDVLDAWQYYLANENHGRPVVLIGHSQGTGHLNKLIKDEIDPNPDVRSLLVGAYLLGGAVKVPEGQDVGGDFQNVPLCRATDQTGCVVTYASFRSTSPPPDDSFFGKPRGGDGVAGCVNPASPAGGSAELHNYFPASAAQDPTVTTPYVSFPGLLTAMCKNENGYSYLEVTVHGDPSTPRVDDIPGDLTPEWGLHLVDANMAMGDIVAMVHQQVQAFGQS